MAAKKAIFIDKDGTLIPDLPYNVDPAKITLAVNSVKGLRQLHRAGYKLIVVSNQSGIAMGMFEPSALWRVEFKLRGLMAREGLYLGGFYYCPHHPEGALADYRVDCSCRKPAPGLILKAAADYDLELSKSWMIGDILNDVEAGHNAGCRSVMIDNGNETEWDLNRKRIPDAMVKNINQAAEYILHHTLRLEKHESGTHSIDR
ncbi:D-glycero-alpha-D-manno-heptose-1,7-bisphosphate 7-phosphatase [Pedobacter immunditicola]|uniref:D-glycero-alpha-D-manno-heptose-1,7-bisphosphate 7-phosphatase n=1 Tax=Pedobacter immunditicola TaxID=3133440 RepID=UPI0030A1E055